MKELKKKNKFDELISNARNSGLSFSEMNELETRVAIDQIMFKGAAICGCPLPQTELFAKYIAEEIKNYILDFGYSELTLDEIVLAFRINIGHRIKNSLGDDLICVDFYGHAINVSFIGKVLANYLVIRKSLDSRILTLLDGY
jgi:hypothetical protein